MPPQPLHASAQKVQDALERQGLALNVVEMPATTRSAQEAANAIGCKVAQIAKSLVFKTKGSGSPILVITSGSNRVNEQKLAAILGEGIERPDAEFVRQVTGFAIGGIPPLGHRRNIFTFIDEDLQQYDTVWAAAGTSNTVFKITPHDLQRITQGRVIAVH